MTNLLEVEGLGVRLPTEEGYLTVVDDVTFSLSEGRVFGLAGESGSGKSMTVLALMGLLPRGGIADGRAMFDGADLLSMPPKRVRQICGQHIGMVFQDPMSSLHPMLTVGRQLTEHVRHHRGATKEEARKRAVDLLDEVRIPDPERSLDAFPHQFSGGMRQRIAIAIALACSPKLLIADEPTTSLDVTVQAGILHLLDRIQRASGLSIIVITHDLAVMSAIADDVAILYAGELMEYGRVDQVLSDGRHPYTRGLIDALPNPGTRQNQPLVPIGGNPATPKNRPSGCAFHPRCKHVQESCRVHHPPLEATADGRLLRCPVDPHGGA